MTHALKLQELGISGTLLDWFRDYLAGRTLTVKFASVVSTSTTAVSSGVSQGPCLGPFLFCLFINDVTEILRGKQLLFADDIKVFSEILSMQKQLELQEDLGRIKHWCSENAMVLNASKYIIMSIGRMKHFLIFHYSINGTLIKRVMEVKDLGVIITPTLNPCAHIDKIYYYPGNYIRYVDYSGVLRVLNVYETKVIGR